MLGITECRNASTNTSPWLREKVLPHDFFQYVVECIQTPSWSARRKKNVKGFNKSVFVKCEIQIGEVKNIKPVKY